MLSDDDEDETASKVKASSPVKPPSPPVQTLRVKQEIIKTEVKTEVTDVQTLAQVTVSQERFQSKTLRDI